MSKLEELRARAIEMLEDDDELFCDMVEELDGWNGFADGFRCYPMWEVDDLFSRVSDFLDKCNSDFNPKDNYFVETVYGIESTDYREEVYRDNTDSEEVLEHVIDYRNHLYIGNVDFADIVDAIIAAEDNEEESEE